LTIFALKIAQIHIFVSVHGAEPLTERVKSLGTFVLPLKGVHRFEEGFSVVPKHFRLRRLSFLTDLINFKIHSPVLHLGYQSRVHYFAQSTQAVHAVNKGEKNDFKQEKGKYLESE